MIYAGAYHAGWSQHIVRPIWREIFSMESRAISCLLTFYRKVSLYKETRYHYSFNDIALSPESFRAEASLVVPVGVSIALCLRDCTFQNVRPLWTARSIRQGLLCKLT